MKRIILFLLFALLIPTVYAADGDLDTSFDGDGKVVVSQNSPTFAEVFEDLAIQPDGKIVAVGTQNNNTDGNQQFLIFRLNSDGSLDSNFGTGGRATIQPSPNATNDAQSVVIQPDGKILVGGTGAGSFLLARLNADGSPDTTFDADGKLEITGLAFFGALALEPQTGKIYAGGAGILLNPTRGAFTIYRLNPNGSLDTTFDGDGRVQTAVGVVNFGSGNLVDGLAIQADGKIVAAGESLTTAAHTDFTLLRYNPNGSLDTSFDGDGIVTTAFGNSRSRALEVVLQPDGKIVAVGDQDQTNTIDDLTIVRYNPNGTLDSSFGIGGKAVRLGAAGNESDLVIQPDGKIVFVGEQLANGSETRFFVGRLTANGVLDSTFSGDGSTTTAIGVTDIAKAVALQADGKIVVGGVTTAANQSQSQRKFGLARYLNSAGSAPVNNPAFRVADFNGDGRADASVFRNGTWYIARNPSNLADFYGVQFGLGTDKPAPADYDGDNKTDIAVWREAAQSTFYIINSATTTVRIEDFGITGDLLTVGDYDGDGKADLSVYRGDATQSIFFYRGTLNNPNNNTTYLPWGVAGDVPVRGDFDGDGRADTVVYRPGNNYWYIRGSGAGNPIQYVQFGLPSDKRLEGDFDGDGKSDVAVYRPDNGVWYIRQSQSGTIRYVQFGISSDKIVAADYDGDTRTDIAVYRDGLYYILNSSTNQVSYLSFGLPDDIPIASAYIR